MILNSKDDWLFSCDVNFLLIVLTRQTCRSKHLKPREKKKPILYRASSSEVLLSSPELFTELLHISLLFF